MKKIVIISVGILMVAFAFFYFFSSTFLIYPGKYYNGETLVLEINYNFTGTSYGSPNLTGTGDLSWEVDDDHGINLFYKGSGKEQGVFFPQGFKEDLLFTSKWDPDTGDYLLAVIGEKK